ncbi:MAG TPA: hypothetical protein VE175_13530, partial [Woeseiaceae bacterium]|nr:hypothetical protein [Woeseiaceae bacterium]
MSEGNPLSAASRRETLAAAISPSTGFNRLAFGKRFDAVFDSHDPAYYGSLQLGGHATTRNRLGPSTQTQRSDVIAAFSIDYGLPGRPGYTYKRPFDYFTAQLTASSGGGVESLDTLGLLWGTRYESGDAWSGVWGLYGSYDYIAPRLFRVSSTALSLGTTGLLRLGRALALQATATLGVGYAAAGTLRSAGPTDYHYGLAPQALLALRLFLGDRASLDLTA